MPFTVAHTGIVLPLKKWRPHWFSLSGLMAGAMAPDLIYFLLLNTAHRGFSHSWSGLFLFDLPAGVAFAFAFHWLFKYHFIINLPSSLSQRLAGLAQTEFSPHSGRWWLVLVYSVIIGVLTHFGWDSFTHARGEVAVMVPFMLEWVNIFGHWMQVTTIAQHGSTLFGFFLMALFVWKKWDLPVATEPIEERTSADKLRFWIVTGGLSVAAAFGALWMYRTYDPGLAPDTFTTFGLGGFAGFFWAVAAYSVLKRLLGPAPAPSEVRSSYRDE